MNPNTVIFFSLMTSVLLAYQSRTNAQTLRDTPELDRKVESYLAAHAGEWRDMNVPRSDAKQLYDLIIEGKYTRALEIGTSTGYSGIHIAWALAKTGGKLITIDIDEGRHRTAVAHFREAGLSDYVDARLADAHELVKQLPGPFDFVFSDADKEWYKNYFDDLEPKLSVGGCYATHNISGGGRGYGRGWNQAYYDYVTGLPHFVSTMQPGSSLLVSHKTGKK
ncbi:MAG: class I SAM-dependent methyltransferase [Bacteroidales bacterium]